MSMRAFGMRLFSWWQRPRLHANPGAAFAAAPFTEQCIGAAPASRGIYQLYRDGTLLYAGAALSGIRRELVRHLCGEYGRCTRAATGFLYEVTGDPEAALRAYLRTYMASNGGRLPPCNQAKAGEEIS
jgi:hypothetical protein